MKKILKTNEIIKKIIHIPMFIVEKIVDVIVLFLLKIVKIYNIIINMYKKIQNLFLRLKKYKLFTYLLIVNKIILLYILLSIVILLGFLIYIYIALYDLKGIIPHISRYDEIKNFIEYLNLYMYILALFLVLFVLLIFLLLRKKQRFLMISFRIYFYIIILFTIFFYFFNYRYDFVKLDDIKDDYFTSMYTITKVKDEENIYNYLKKYYNYYDNSKISEYKAFIDVYVGVGNYDKFMSDISYSIEGNDVTKYKYLLKLENIDKILNVSKEKQKFIKKLNNYNFFVSSDKSYYGVYNNISSLSKYLDDSKKYNLDELDRELLISRLYLLYNLEINNKKEVIDYFINNYSLWFNVLNGNLYTGDGIFAWNSIRELDSDLLYIKENYNYSKEDLYSIISLLEKKYNNFDTKKIYKNMILNDYKLARKLFEDNIDENNIFIDKEKTINLLKNYYYSMLSTSDYSQVSFTKTNLFKNIHICDNIALKNISPFIDCDSLKLLRKNFIGNNIVNFYFISNLFVIDNFDELKIDLETIISELSNDEIVDKTDINWIIKNTDSETLFEEGGENIFNEIHDKFYDKDEKGNNLITDEGLKSLKEKMMYYTGEDKYDIDKIIVKPTYFYGNKGFYIEYYDGNRMNSYDLTYGE